MKKGLFARPFLFAAVGLDGSFCVRCVIDVALLIEGVKGVAIVLGECETFADTAREVGIGDEVPSEGHGVCVSAFDHYLGGLGFEASRGDDGAFEYLAELLGGD